MKQVIDLLSKHKAVGFLVSTLIITILLFLTLFLYGQTMLAFKEGAKLDRNNEYPANTITVEGKGEVIAMPNIAQFTFTVSEQAGTSEEAQQMATTKINTVTDLLINAGVEQSDIETTSYNIYPNYTYETREITIYGDVSSSDVSSGESVITSYEASQTTTVKVRDIDNAGNLIALVGQQGVSGVSSLEFTVDEFDVIQAEARTLAIKDARMQAQKIADDLGVRLVRVVSYYENNHGYPEPMYDMARMESAMSSAPKLSPGEEEVLKTVSVTYEIR